METTQLEALVSQKQVHLNSLDPETRERILLASQDTARRSSLVIANLLLNLKEQMTQPKTHQWRKDVSGQIDALRYQSLDGIQAQFTANFITLDEQNQAATTLNDMAIEAKKSLFSNPSPLLGAHNFEPLADKLVKSLQENAREAESFSEQDRASLIEKASQIQSSTPTER